MPKIIECFSDTILAKAQSRDIEAGLGIWSLLHAESTLPDVDELERMLDMAVQDYFLRARIVRNGFQITSIGKRLRQLTVAFTKSCHRDDLPPDLADMLGALFAEAHNRRHPVYETRYSRHSKLVHRWEMLIMPALDTGEPAILAMILPLEFRQDLLLAIVEANPVGVCAVEVVRNNDGNVSDFRICLANDAACDAIGKDHMTLLHSSLSVSIPELLTNNGKARLQTIADTARSEFFEYARTTDGVTRTFGITASCRGDNLVLTFTEITDLMEARAQLTAQHQSVLATNAELRRQKEHLHATAESLEIARQALSAEVQRRATLESRLRHLAETDSMTGLANRRHFVDLAEAELRRTQRYGGTFSLAMLDIDHFKSINDTWGHGAGDKVIGAVASTCRRHSRADLDAVGRVGGEEFAILLPQTDLAGATDLAERFRQEISDMEVTYEETGITLTASIGVAEFHPDDTDITDVFKRADKALYLAKNAGRNRVEPLAA